MRIETRYIPRRSLRSFRLWLAHVGAMKTFVAGPMLLLRFCGLSINIYPWGKSDKQLRQERDSKSPVYDPKQFRRR